jgi:hypothetical protein
MSEVTTIGILPFGGCDNSNVIGVVSRVTFGAVRVGHGENNFVLTSDLKHFIDMVYLYGTQYGFLPSYVSGNEFKKNIEDVRRFEKFGLSISELAIECSHVRIAASKNAYTYALIVYGFIKELAVRGNGDASRVYDALKQLMPYKIC